MDSSPMLEEDMLKLHQLKAQARPDSQVISLLSQKQKRFLQRLQADEASVLATALSFDLGNAYHQLPTATGKPTPSKQSPAIRKHYVFGQQILLPQSALRRRIGWEVLPVIYQRGTEGTI